MSCNQTGADQTWPHLARWKRIPLASLNGSHKHQASTENSIAHIPGDKTGRSPILTGLCLNADADWHCLAD
ncbi:MAG: hypothetical protein KDK39_15170 [Leptospiraceae bacterium]|nr:hypothetical protein [Leptospiraceae bacterium]